MAKQLDDYEIERPAVHRRAMSHTDIFHDIAFVVIPLVTEHVPKDMIRWTMDRHYHPNMAMSHKNMPQLKRSCWCCCARKPLDEGCELCTTAWQLSKVSKYMLSSVKQNGMSIPRWWYEWSAEERAEKKKAWKAEKGSKGCKGYKPHSQGGKGDELQSQGGKGYEPHSQRGSSRGWKGGRPGRWFFCP